MTVVKGLCKINESDLEIFFLVKSKKANIESHHQAIIYPFTKQTEKNYKHYTTECLTSYHLKLLPSRLDFKTQILLICRQNMTVNVNLFYRPVF